jgi:hypothetical protein
MRMLPVSTFHHAFARCLRNTSLALTLSLICAPVFAVPAELMDQNGIKGGMADFSGKPVIVFVTSLTKMANLGKWEEAIRPKLPDINTMDIGDINSSSKFLLKELDKELAKHVPSGVRMYIDPKNIWAKEYKLDLGDPCVLIFDADHNLVKTFRGKPKGDLIDQAVAAAAPYFPQADPSKGKATPPE